MGQGTGQQRGNARQSQVEGHGPVLPVTGVSGWPQTGADHPDQFVPKVNQDRKQGPEVRRHVEDKTLVGPAQGLAAENQVR